MVEAFLITGNNIVWISLVVFGPSSRQANDSLAAESRYLQPHVATEKFS